VKISSLAGRVGIAVASLMVAVPLSALAGGGPITAHQLTIKIKALSQTTNGKGDDVGDSTGANQKDVFQTCVGTSPTKTQGMYLFLDCSNLNNNVIAAIDTNPLFDTAVGTGDVSFDMAHMVTTQKKGVLVKAVVPVDITLSCNGDATHVDATGIMTINYTALGSSPACPSSASVSVTGTGVNPQPGDFILNSGSSIKAATRSGAIAAFPPLP